MTKGNCSFSSEGGRKIKNNPLKGCRILYLGSSVTRGFASDGVSFADFIAQRCGTEYVKEAVDGTTLVSGEGSYVQRLMQVDRKEKFDLLVCQLSTNDVSKNKPLGTPSPADCPNTDTICGAIRFIIDYARRFFNCRVVFYTNPYYKNEKYAQAVSALHIIAEMYEIDVIDLYNDREFNSISEAQRGLYMADEIHPTAEGYLEWWTPKFEQGLAKVFLGKR